MVFLCHASEDKPAVRKLYDRLKASGISVWLDEVDLVYGTDWEWAINRAIREANAVLVCLSLASVSKAGFVQREIGFVLDRAAEQPEGRVFLIPVRLDPCRVPDRLSKWHYVNLFDQRAYERLLATLKGANIRRGFAEAEAEGSHPNSDELEAAASMAVTGRWAEAANHYDNYCRLHPENWEAQFNRAVAHANVGEPTANLAALRAYNEAIALHPPDIEPSTRARLHAYRGGILKRLRRFDEARAQLEFAQQLATEPFEQDDIAYNLACIASVQGRVDEATKLVRYLLLKGWTAFESAYFENLRDAPEFSELVALNRKNRRIG